MRSSLIHILSTVLLALSQPVLAAGNQGYVPKCNLDGIAGAKKKKRVFPLNLSALDTYFMEDDLESHPMNFAVTMDFQGQVNREAFEAALTQATERHPLTRAIVGPAKGGRPGWKDSKTTPPVEWISLNDAIEPATKQLDLTKAPGMRFWVQNGDESSRITIDVHHAVTDGTGLYRFIGDLLAGYANKINDPDDQLALPDVDTDLLKGRHYSVISPEATDTLAEAFQKPDDAEILNKIEARVGKQVKALFGDDIAPLRPREPRGDETISYPGFLKFSLSKEQRDGLKKLAQQKGGTLNDLLVTQLFRTIRKWNGKDEQMQIMLPYDLRQSADYDMPATNMTGFTFPKIGPKFTDFDEMFAHVAQQTRELKSSTSQTRFEFTDVISQGHITRAALEEVGSTGRTVASAVLSNTDDQSKRFRIRFPRTKDKKEVIAGNLILTDIGGVAPNKKGVPVTISVGGYLRQMGVCLKCDPNIFSPKDSQGFADMLRDDLIELIQP